MIAGLAVPAVADVRAPAAFKGPSLIETEAALAKPEAAPHQGGGRTTAYRFFESAPNLGWVFRKRVLHRGAAIGSHLHDKDEIYYVLSGRGELTLDGKKQLVSAGTAILTRPGSTHSLRQVGDDDLALIVSYEKAPQPPIASPPAQLPSPTG